MYALLAPEIRAAQDLQRTPPTFALLRTPTGNTPFLGVPYFFSNPHATRWEHWLARCHLERAHLENLFGSKRPQEPTTITCQKVKSQKDLVSSWGGCQTVLTKGSNRSPAKVIHLFHQLHVRKFQVMDCTLGRPALAPHACLRHKEANVIHSL